MLLEPVPVFSSSCTLFLAHRKKVKSWSLQAEYQTKKLGKSWMRCYIFFPSNQETEVGRGLVYSLNYMARPLSYKSKLKKKQKTVAI